MSGLEGVAGVFAVLQVADRVLSICGKYASAVKDAKDDIRRLTSEVNALQKVLKSVDEMAHAPGMMCGVSPSILEELAGTIGECGFTLDQVESQLDPKQRRTPMRRFGFRALKWPFKSKDIASILETLHRQQSTITVALSLDQRKRSDLVDQERQIDKLPYADDAAFNSHFWEQKPCCLPETRVRLLQMVDDWYKSSQSVCIFWLRGMAGTGKSTIARTVARSFADQAQLGASFMFSQGRGDLGNAKKFFTTIAAQLARNVPSLRGNISRAISENPTVLREGLREQWKQLILRPLMRLEATAPPARTFGLVIDALDECEEDDVRLMLPLLAETKALERVRFRIFITSRPETPIRLGFQKMQQGTHQVFALHEIDEKITQHDICLFLTYELENIRRESCLQPEWPDKDSIESLARNSSGLFIYAASACRFIREWATVRPPAESLMHLLEIPTTSESPVGKLDEIYTHILEHSIIKSKSIQGRDELGARFRAIVGPVVILFDTLTCASLAKLIDSTKERVITLLSSLQSVLDISDSDRRPIQLLHPSFRDFLLNRNRCTDSCLTIDETKGHEELARCCLRIMFKGLKNDICGLQSPGATVQGVTDEQRDHHLTSELKYACRYWVEHLPWSKISLHEGDQVHQFLRKHLLHWLEVLSLMKKTSEGVLAILSLESMVSPNENPTLHAYIHDAKRFALSSRSGIEEAPLQLYHSALLFAPEWSLIRNQFKDDVPRWIIPLPKVPRDWGRLPQTFEGHSGWVADVTVSPDGRLVASGSADRTVRLWDSATGSLQATLEGHLDQVFAVAFSPD
ncbi:MAG: hypothetical protein M1816_005900, partial [Peltula sp. TS41687]